MKTGSLKLRMPALHFVRLCVAALSGIYGLNADALTQVYKFHVHIEIQNATGHEMRVCEGDSFNCTVKTVAPGALYLTGVSADTPFPQPLDKYLDRYFSGGYVKLCGEKMLAPNSVVSLASKRQDGRETTVKYVVSEQTYRRECAENGLPRGDETPNFLK